MNETILINRYLKKLTRYNPHALHLDDDIFFHKSKRLAISVDTYNEGTHFVDFKRPDLVIRKIIRSSISDIYAKGAEPKYFFLSGSGNKKKFNSRSMKLISSSIAKEQKKFNIKLSGGDTTSSKLLTFTVITIGFADKIIYRNKCKVGDDIYVTGNIGDSFVGLQILKKKIKVKNMHNKIYFVDKYYSPNLPIKISKLLSKFANSSMDISDGLIIDLNRLMNKQNLGYTVNFNKIPLSKNLNNFIKSKKLLLKDYLLNGDDYQILFTASKSKRLYIEKLSSKMNQKISRIGQINKKLKLYSLNNKEYRIKDLKYQGYLHKF